MTPHSLDAEKGLLSSLLQNPSVLDQAADEIKPTLFFLPNHRIVFEAIVSLWKEGSAIDLITVGEKTSQVDASSLAEIYCFVPTSHNWKEYLTTLKRKRTARVSITEAQKIIETASNPETEDTLSDSVQKALVAVAAEAESGAKIVSIKDAAMARVDEYEEMVKNKGKLMGLTYGLKTLDDHTGGMRPGQLIVIGAPTKGGKTALALNIARRTADAGNPIAIFSLEMSAGEIVDRLVADISGVDISQLSKDPTKDLLSKITFGIQQIAKLPIYIRDESSINPLQIMAATRRMVAAHGVKLVIFDYIQLCTPSNNKENRERQVAEVSRCLKLIAKELGIVVLSLTQLNKNGTSRESDAIMHDLDMFYIIRNSEEDGIFLDLRLARNCSRTSFPLNFDPQYLRFTEREFKK